MVETTKKTVVQPTLNTSVLKVVKVEKDSVIVLVEGWRMRVYFENGTEDVGIQVEVKHYGDINNPHEVKFQKVK